MQATKRTVIKKFIAFKYSNVSSCRPDCGWLSQVDLKVKNTNFINQFLKN